MTRKTIQITLELTSDNRNYVLCEAIEQVLLGSSMNNSEYSLTVDEVKVIDERRLCDTANS